MQERFKRIFLFITDMNIARSDVLFVLMLILINLGIVFYHSITRMDFSNSAQYQILDAQFAQKRSQLMAHRDSILASRYFPATELLTKKNDKKSARNKTKSATIKLININTATVEELVSLPGIGENTAEAIIEIRLRFEQFNSLDDLLEVKGIGPRKLEKLKQHITLE